MNKGSTQKTRPCLQSKWLWRHHEIFEHFLIVTNTGAYRVSACNGTKRDWVHLLRFLPSLLKRIERILVSFDNSA